MAIIFGEKYFKRIVLTMMQKKMFSIFYYFNRSNRCNKLSFIKAINANEKLLLPF